MSNRDDILKGKHTFIIRKKKGVCPCCNENVYDNQLYVEEHNVVYHYSCYNESRAKEDNGEQS